jgi:hypothetical protein
MSGVAVDMIIMLILGHHDQLWWVIFVRSMFWSSFVFQLNTNDCRNDPLD